MNWRGAMSGASSGKVQAYESPRDDPNASIRDSAVVLDDATQALPQAPALCSGSNAGIKEAVARHSLGSTALKYTVDCVAAAGSAFLVSPFITIVDRSIIENTSGKRKLTDALRALTLEFLSKPHHFIGQRSFQWIWGLYFATYITANTIDTTCDLLEKDNSLLKFVGTTAVNMTLCIAKDRAFTRMFGLGAPKPLPPASYAFFAVRDSMTIAASFNMPPIISKMLQESGWKESSAGGAAQLLCPGVVQVLSTPLHLLGLDLYNRPAASVAERGALIQKEYTKSVIARIGRIGPAFGFGGIGNKYLRDTLADTLGLKDRL